MFVSAKQVERGTKVSDGRELYSSSSVDPFAPFSEYYYDAFDENSFDSSWKSPQISKYFKLNVLCILLM